ncbi:MAG TPA: RNA polymerase-associated protein RapA, partial [Gammaproteobacteria bacterium]|nr:RNA polymerase-associated protein RapA [Gammaproteobacteria bacterium]
MFVIGQRWMSEAEPDLGLGSVVEVEGRRVKLRFPATGEERTYAQQGAPLSRVRFDVGEEIEDAAGNRLEVLEAEERDGLVRYRCRTPDGQVVELPEQQLDDRMRLNRPQDKLLARRIDPDAWFGLRYRTWLRNADNWRSPVFGLVGPRVDLIPHQLYIAHEVASRQAPRVLLADEVGLGKTIEAGLIMHRLLLSERVRRVLIVVPEALLYQWLVEMLRRFNLRLSIFDDDRFVASDEENPFLGEQRVL